MEPWDSAVRAAIYRAFVETGEPPAARDLAAALGRPAEQIEQALVRLNHVGGVVIDGDSRAVRMAKPFSGVPTAFELTSANGHWFANCALDALAIAALLGRDLRIDSRCVDCGEPLHLDVAGATGPVAGDAGCVYFGLPIADWWHDIVFT